jgi:hypothetical protein
MHANDLAFYTTQELISELMQRKTFLGVVIHSSDEHRGREWAGKGLFKLHFDSNLDTDQAARLLERVARYLATHNEG